MSTLLKIDVSPRGDYSISRKLGNHFATEWQSNHVGGKIVTRDLATTKIPYVDLPWIAGAFSAELSHLARPTKKRKTAPSRQRSCACCTHGKLLCNLRNTASPIVPRAYASSAIHLPSTVQRTAQRRSLQTKYLTRYAFNISFLPRVLQLPPGLNRQPDCKTLHVATVDSLLSAAEPPSISHLRVMPRTEVSCYQGLPVPHP